MTRTITRFGQKVEPDEAFDASGSGDLHRMLAALPLKTNGVDRHYLLLGAVEALYARRSDPALRQRLIEVANVHLREMPHLLGELRRHDACRDKALTGAVAAKGRAAQWVAPAIPTFDHLCIVHCETGHYDLAREVWRDAVDCGYLEERGLTQCFSLIEKRRKRAMKAPTAGRQK